MKKLTLTLAVVALMSIAGNAQSVEQTPKKEQTTKHETVNPDGTATTVDNGEKAKSQSGGHKSHAANNSTVKEAPANKEKATPAKKEAPATKPAEKKPAGATDKK